MYELGSKLIAENWFTTLYLPYVWFLIGAYESILPTGTLFRHVRCNIVAYKADFRHVLYIYFCLYCVAPCTIQKCENKNVPWFRGVHDLLCSSLNILSSYYYYLSIFRKLQRERSLIELWMRLEFQTTQGKTDWRDRVRRLSLFWCSRVLVCLQYWSSTDPPCSMLLRRNWRKTSLLQLF